MRPSKLVCLLVALSFVVLLLPLSGTAPTASAETQAQGPVYIVQNGDTLTSIAARFRVSLDALIQANQIADPNVVVPGTPLVIPGIAGYSGVLDTAPVDFGQTLTSLSRYYHMDATLLTRINHITSPAELYVGTTLILPKQDEQAAKLQNVSLSGGESLLDLSLVLSQNPWALASSNGLGSLWDPLPGEDLFAPAEKTASRASGLIASVSLSPLPLTQGKTVEVRVDTSSTAELQGSLGETPLHFFALAPNQYVALQGIHAMQDPGIVEFNLTAKDGTGSTAAVSQAVLVVQGNYPQDPPLSVDPATIDPKITGPEDQLVSQVTSQVTASKLWQGEFQPPVAQPYCIKSGFGSRRSYNGGVLKSFHGGTDFGVCNSSDPFSIYAVADGVVAYTGKLEVRGNATFINHGWGVYTAYFHQSEILVKPGDVVKAGQLIGKIGATGRVTGPHLHWEVWVGGIQVDPLQWLGQTFPF
jgi:murein DD-endopeptidase MepM/ murein hydrolase activator NlpD